MKIIKPTILIDKEKVLENISAMKEKVMTNNLIFRPHFKTHQNINIGEWYREFGVDKITVSSVSMAIKFAQAGWADITIAFPLNILEIPIINKKLSNISLNLLVDNIQSLKYAEENLETNVGIFVKIDTGYHRAGILSTDINKIDGLLTYLNSAKQLTFKGFLTHSGNSYNAVSQNEIIKIHESSLIKLEILKARYIAQYPNLIISYGDTPTSILSNNFDGVDELRPGVFVFKDLMIQKLTGLDKSEIAIAVACPIVGIYPERNEILIYGGAVHFSKDYLLDSKGEKYFGETVKIIDDNQWAIMNNSSKLIALSQEHGIIKANDKLMASVNIGDVIAILPIHACLTMSSMMSND